MAEPRRPALTREPLRSEELAADPFTQFERWFADAVSAGQPEPEAMAVATVGPDSQPSVRFVLMRGRDERGWVFYTNRSSRKGRELAQVASAAAVFRWATVDRQVRLSGPAEATTEAESDAYFASRPRGSQLAAWASDQSAPVTRPGELEDRYREVTARFGEGPVPRPDWWGGYRITPSEVEFWQQGEFRMHQRFLYTPDPAGGWDIRQLQP